MDTIHWYNGLQPLSLNATYPPLINKECPKSKWAATDANTRPSQRTMITLQNRGSKPLYLVDARIESGEWAFCPSGADPSANEEYLNRPCDVIYPNSECRYGSESWGVMTGTEHRAIYSYEPIKRKMDISIRIDNPYYGSNVYDITAKGGVKYSRTGGSGNLARTTIQVWF